MSGPAPNLALEAGLNAAIAAPGTPRTTLTTLGGAERAHTEAVLARWAREGERALAQSADTACIIALREPSTTATEVRWRDGWWRERERKAASMSTHAGDFLDACERTNAYFAASKAAALEWCRTQIAQIGPPADIARALDRAEWLWRPYAKHRSEACVGVRPAHLGALLGVCDTQWDEARACPGWLRALAVECGWIGNLPPERWTQVAAAAALGDRATQGALGLMEAALEAWHTRPARPPLKALAIAARAGLPTAGPTRFAAAIELEERLDAGTERRASGADRALAMKIRAQRMLQRVRRAAHETARTRCAEHAVGTKAGALMVIGAADKALAAILAQACEPHEAKMRVRDALGAAPSWRLAYRSATAVLAGLAPRMSSSTTLGERFTEELMRSHSTVVRLERGTDRLAGLAMKRPRPERARNASAGDSVATREELRRPGTATLMRAIDHAVAAALGAQREHAVNDDQSAQETTQ